MLQRELTYIPTSGPIYLNGNRIPLNRESDYLRRQLFDSLTRDVHNAKLFYKGSMLELCRISAYDDIKRTPLLMEVWRALIKLLQYKMPHTMTFLMVRNVNSGVIFPISMRELCGIELHTEQYGMIYGISSATFDFLSGIEDFSEYRKGKAVDVISTMTVRQVSDVIFQFRNINDEYLDDFDKRSRVVYLMSRIENSLSRLTTSTSITGILDTSKIFQHVIFGTKDFHCLLEKSINFIKS